MKLLFALRNCGIVEGKEESVIMSNSKKTPNARQTVVQRILLWGREELSCLWTSRSSPVPLKWGDSFSRFRFYRDVFAGKPNLLSWTVSRCWGALFVCNTAMTLSGTEQSRAGFPPDAPAAADVGLDGWYCSPNLGDELRFPIWDYVLRDSMRAGKTCMTTKLSVFLAVGGLELSALI